MEPNSQIQVGLLPAQTLTSLLTDDEDNWRDVPEGQTVVPLVKIEKPATGAWEPSLVWFADRVERQWVAGTPAPAPTFTAEQWLENQGYQNQRPTNCLYLKLQLAAAGKSSAKLDAVETWMNHVIFVGAQDPDATHSDLPAAPFTFAETSQEALAVLKLN